MKPRADTCAATPRREVAPPQHKLPPAALALARLIGEAVGERLWREALTADHGEAIAQDASQSGKPQRIAEPRSQGDARSCLIAWDPVASGHSRPPGGHKKAPERPCYSGRSE
jgi:hypothetical protein